jgi:hypothetical protein
LPDRKDDVVEIFLIRRERADGHTPTPLRELRRTSPP